MQGFSQCQPRLRECLKEISARRKATNGKNPWYTDGERDLMRACWKKENITVAEEKAIFHVHGRINTKVYVDRP